uniref:RRM domain-containing protein n=1 Tax=Macrostomum lignano TaxID=282301 RepID=A0A1I8GG48_9PLAT
MAMIIRLQNLSWNAQAADVRRFFSGLFIPEGGVHIVGGEFGDAFITFGTEDDARLALRLNGQQLCGEIVKLFVSSTSEMQQVVARAKQAAAAAAAVAAAPPPSQAAVLPSNLSNRPQPAQQLGSQPRMPPPPHQSQQQPHQPPPQLSMGGYPPEKRRREAIDATYDYAEYDHAMSSAGAAAADSYQRKNAGGQFQSNFRRNGGNAYNVSQRYHQHQSDVPMSNDGGGRSARFPPARDGRAVPYGGDQVSPSSGDQFPPGGSDRFPPGSRDRFPHSIGDQHPPASGGQFPPGRQIQRDSPSQGNNHAFMADNRDRWERHPDHSKQQPPINRDEPSNYQGATNLESFQQPPAFQNERNPQDFRGTFSAQNEKVYAESDGWPYSSNKQRSFGGDDLSHQSLEPEIRGRSRGRGRGLGRGQSSNTEWSSFNKAVDPTFSKDRPVDLTLPKDEKAYLVSMKDEEAELVSTKAEVVDLTLSKDEEAYLVSTKDEEAELVSTRAEVVDLTLPKDEEAELVLIMEVEEAKLVSTKAEDEEAYLVSTKDEEANLVSTKAEVVDLTLSKDEEAYLVSTKDEEAYLVSTKDEEAYLEAELVSTKAEVVDLTLSKDEKAYLVLIMKVGVHLVLMKVKVHQVLMKVEVHLTLLQDEEADLVLRKAEAVDLTILKDEETDLVFSKAKVELALMKGEKVFLVTVKASVVLALLKFKAAGLVFWKSDELESSWANQVISLNFQTEVAYAQLVSWADRIARLLPMELEVVRTRRNGVGNICMLELARTLMNKISLRLCITTKFLVVNLEFQKDAEADQDSQTKEKPFDRTETFLGNRKVLKETSFKRRKPLLVEAALLVLVPVEIYSTLINQGLLLRVFKVEPVASRGRGIGFRRSRFDNNTNDDIRASEETEIPGAPLSQQPGSGRGIGFALARNRMTAIGAGIRPPEQMLPRPQMPHQQQTQTMSGQNADDSATMMIRNIRNSSDSTPSSAPTEPVGLFRPRPWEVAAADTNRLAPHLVSPEQKPEPKTIQPAPQERSDHTPIVQNPVVSASPSRQRNQSPARQEQMKTTVPVSKTEAPAVDPSSVSAPIKYERGQNDAHYLALRDVPLDARYNDVVGALPAGVRLSHSAIKYEADALRRRTGQVFIRLTDIADQRRCLASPKTLASRIHVRQSCEHEFISANDPTLSESKMVAEAGGPLPSYPKCPSPYHDDCCLEISGLPKPILRDDLVSIFGQSVITDPVNDIFIDQSKCPFTATAYVHFSLYSGFQNALSTDASKHFPGASVCAISMIQFREYATISRKAAVASLSDINLDFRLTRDQRLAAASGAATVAKGDSGPDDSKQVCVEVQNLPLDATTQELRDFFNPFIIERDAIQLIVHGSSLQAFAQFIDSKVASDAVAKNDGRRLRGAVLALRLRSLGQRREALAALGISAANTTVQAAGQKRLSCVGNFCKIKNCTAAHKWSKMSSRCRNPYSRELQFCLFDSTVRSSLSSLLICYYPYS